MLNSPMRSGWPVHHLYITTCGYATPSVLQCVPFVPLPVRFSVELILIYPALPAYAFPPHVLPCLSLVSITVVHAFCPRSFSLVSILALLFWPGVCVALCLRKSDCKPTKAKKQSVDAKPSKERCGGTDVCDADWRSSNAHDAVMAAEVMGGEQLDE